MEEEDKRSFSMMDEDIKDSSISDGDSRKFIRKEDDPRKFDMKDDLAYIKYCKYVIQKNVTNRHILEPN